MPQPPDHRRHFIVKHDLQSFEDYPTHIWRTGNGEDDKPHRFNQVKLGDRWIGFAYTTSDKRERSLSRVTGFFQCESEADFVALPPTASGRPVSAGRHWLIKGEVFGEQPMNTVGVEPIDEILGKKLWKNQAIVPLTADDFDTIRQHALTRQFDTTKIPLLGREPENEQEVLAAVVYGHEQLGIKRIYRVRKAFPDLLVQLEGCDEPVHLELEVYSEGFFSHGHNQHVKEKRFTGDDRPIAVLCWIDNKKSVKDHVHRVYELQSLIRDRKKIIW